MSEESVLEGRLTREERAQVAADVIATLTSRQRKFTMASRYFSGRYKLPASGQLTSARIKGECLVCARGMLFIKAVDRFNRCSVDKMFGVVTSVDVKSRTSEDFGLDQAEAIEDAFEGTSYEGYAFWSLDDNPRDRMIRICRNIIRNRGEFLADTEQGGSAR